VKQSESAGAAARNQSHFFLAVPEMIELEGRSNGESRASFRKACLP
jgi:hypothetical protein